MGPGLIVGAELSGFADGLGVSLVVARIYLFILIICFFFDLFVFGYCWCVFFSSFVLWVAETGRPPSRSFSVSHRSLYR